jgi:hypothetical protein
MNDAFGSRGEAVVRNWLKNQGYYVIATSLIENGGAPLLEGQIRSIILPDIIAAKDGYCCLVDVKSKGRRTRHVSQGCMTTGCALRHYDNYKRASQITGMPAALCFLFADVGECHFGLIEEIGIHNILDVSPEWLASHPNHAYTEDMVFFNIDPNHDSQFRLITGEKDLVWENFKKAATPPKTVHPGERRKKDTPGQRRLF